MRDGPAGHRGSRSALRNKRDGTKVKAQPYAPVPDRGREAAITLPVAPIRMPRPDRAGPENFTPNAHRRYGPLGRRSPLWCYKPINRTRVARAHRHTSLEFWVTLEGRKAHSGRGHQQEAATPAEQRRQGVADRKRAAAARNKNNRGRKRAEAAARREAAKRRARRRRLLIAVAVVLVVGIGTAGLIYGMRPPSISVSGAFGTKPTVTIPSIDPPASLRAQHLISGHGALVAKGDLAVVDLTAYTWAGTATKKISELSTGQPEPLTVGSTIPGLDKSLEGSRVGSRLLITIPPKDGFGSKGDSSLGVSGKDTLLFVADVLGAYQKTASAHGTHEVVKATGLPTVSTSSPGTAPPVHIPQTAPPATLQVQTLIQGTGPVVKKGQLLIAHYEGVIWRTGKVFDSSWQRGVPAGFQIGTGQVIKGWDDGLVGKRVGSQVLLVVPPADGYGKTGSSQAGIKGTDTLVFVVDILGTY
jgi:FKBP-type peptidyl-prolyl cis-trans isomerase